MAAAAFAATALTGSSATLAPGGALRRALGDGGANPVVKSFISRSAAPRLLKTVDTPAGVPAAYIYGRDNGFLVVAADDVALPLLGYSDAPLSADGQMPPQMAWWLGEYGRQIDYARSKAPASAPAINMADSRADRAPIAPLLTTYWNQDAPFNDLCPEIGGKRAVTGCVATAMAQVMKYHAYPAKGFSSISYKLNGETLSMNFAETTFDWGNMLDSYAGGYSEAQSTAVATLMKACGYATQMKYSASESGTTSDLAAKALKTYFGYDAALDLKNRDFYPLDRWEEMVYENLRDCGPVLYGGTDYTRTSGHEFVCDGYSADGYFHFNWGWGGAYDGYFLLTALNPAGLGIGGGLGGGFNFSQDAIFGIRRPTGQTVKYDNRLSLYGVLGASVSGATLTLNAGNGGAFINMTDRTFGVELGVKLVNAAGQVSYIQGPAASGVQPGYGATEYAVSLSSVKEGTYKVYPVCRPTGNGASAEWLDVYQSIQYPGYVVLTATGGSYSVAAPAVELPKASNVKAVTGVYAGRAYQFTADLTNVADMEMFMPVSGGIATMTDGKLNIKSAGDVVCVDLTVGATRNYTFSGTAPAQAADDYYFVIYDRDRYEVLFYAKFPVQANPGNPALSCSSFSIEGGTQGVNASAIKFKANVGVTAGFLDKPLVIALFGSESNESIAMDYFPVAYLGAGQSADLATTYNFTLGQVGKTYTAGLFDPYDTSNMLSYLTFTVGTSGIESVSADGGIVITEEAGSLIVSAPAGIASADLYGIDGTRRALPVSAGESSATLSLQSVLPGVYAVSVTDLAGHRITRKIVVR